MNKIIFFSTFIIFILFVGLVSWIYKNDVYAQTACQMRIFTGYSAGATGIVFTAPQNNQYQSFRFDYSRNIYGTSGNVEEFLDYLTQSQNILASTGGEEIAEFIKLISLNSQTAVFEVYYSDSTPAIYGGNPIDLYCNLQVDVSRFYPSAPTPTQSQPPVAAIRLIRPDQAIIDGTLNNFAITYSIENLFLLNSPRIKFELLKNDILLGTIFEGITYSDSSLWNYSWGVGEYVNFLGEIVRAPVGGGYKIRATLLDNQTVVSQYVSLYPFEILYSQSGQLSLQIVSPNGKEIWRKGTRQVIKWQNSGNVSLVSLRMSYQYPNSNGSITGTEYPITSFPVNNTGSREFVIPTNIPEGMAKIVVTGYSADKLYNVYDQSDNFFTIGSSPIVRFRGESKVYQLLSGTILKWISTESVFNQLGLNWQDIQIRPLSEKKKYREAKLWRAENQSEVYFISNNGFKKLVPTAEIFLSYGNKFENVIVVKNFELNAIPESNLITWVEDPMKKVYKIENGQKRWVTSASVFSSLGFDWNSIIQVNKFELDYYPNGADLIGTMPLPTPTVPASSVVIRGRVWYDENGDGIQDGFVKSSGSVCSGNHYFHIINFSNATPVNLDLCNAGGPFYSQNVNSDGIEVSLQINPDWQVITSNPVMVSKFQLEDGVEDVWFGIKKI